MIVMAACTTPGAPIATETVADVSQTPPTAEIVTRPAATQPATTEPEPTSEPPTIEPESPAVPQSGGPTGILDVDLVIAALLTNDREALRQNIQFRDVGCTTELGMGGPPKCPEGSADGNLVTVFPILGPEGAFVSPDDVDNLIDGFEVESLFGVYQVPPDTEDLDYWPAGTYGIVMSGTGEVPAYTFVMDRGKVVRIIYHFGESAAEAFDHDRAGIILAPVE